MAHGVAVFVSTPLIRSVLASDTVEPPHPHMRDIWVRVVRVDSIWGRGCGEGGG